MEKFGYMSISPQKAFFNHIRQYIRLSCLRFTDDIRLVRNGSSGPMFVVPEDEFTHITQSMQSGEEVRYALILANVHKKGIQKLEFTVEKR